MFRESNRYFFSTAECDMILDQSNGVITSPGFPQRYRDFIDCTWLIQLPFGNFIAMNFLHFDIQFRSYSKKCR